MSHVSSLLCAPPTPFLLSTHFLFCSYRVYLAPLISHKGRLGSLQFRYPLDICFLCKYLLGRTYPCTHAIANTPLEFLSVSANFQLGILSSPKRQRLDFQVAVFRGCYAFTGVTACVPARHPLDDFVNGHPYLDFSLYSHSSCKAFSFYLGWTFTIWI